MESSVLLRSGIRTSGPAGLVLGEAVDAQARYVEGISQPQAQKAIAKFEAGVVAGANEVVGHLKSLNTLLFPVQHIAKSLVMEKQLSDMEDPDTTAKDQERRPERRGKNKIRQDEADEAYEAGVEAGKRIEDAITAGELSDDPDWQEDISDELDSEFKTNRIGKDKNPGIKEELRDIFNDGVEKGRRAATDGFRPLDF